MRNKIIAVLLAWCLIGLSAASAAEEAWPVIRESRLPGLTEDSWAAWPVLVRADGQEDETLTAINCAVYDEGGMKAYLGVLMRPGGSAGFQADFEAVLTDRLYAVRLSARGRMPVGPPSRRFEPFLFDWRTGRRLTLADVFESPDAAIAAVETYLSERVAPELSDYLETAELLPLPADRFLIANDTILFDYTPETYALLSGGAGSVSLTLEELALITGEGEALLPFARMPFSPDENTARGIFADAAAGCFPGLWLSLEQKAGLGAPLEEALRFGAKCLDSMHYPAGAALETENPFLRGILILTDENGERVQGYLARRGNLYGLAVGRADQAQVRAALGEPEASLPVSREAAEQWLTDEGTRDVYRMQMITGESCALSFGYNTDGTLTTVLYALEETSTK